MTDTFPFDDRVELALRLEKLPSWDFEDVVLHRISDGYTNINFRMECSRGEFFLKLPGAGTEAFIDRRVAHEAAAFAGESGIGPRVIYFDEHSGIEVSDFLTGYRSASFSSFADDEFVEQLIDLYRRWHQGPLLSSTKTLFDMIDEHLLQLGEAHHRLEPYQRATVDLWMPLQEAYIAAGLDIVPGHNDMLPSNYMTAPGSPIMLIDYDYAANTDRFYEIGAMLTIGGFSAARRAQLIELYTGAPETPVTTARLHACAVGTYVKWGLWGLLNAATRETDFDYQKYGSGMLAQAYTMLQEPACELALTTLTRASTAHH